MLITVTAVCGVSDGAGHTYPAGAVVDVADDLGKAWTDAGHAEPVKAAAKAEKSGSGTARKS